MKTPLFSLHQTHVLRFCALVAKIRAMKSALIYAIDMGCYNITVRSDSQSLIHLLNSTETHLDIDVLLEDIRELALSFDSIIFQFVPRISNVIADDLAKKALLALEQFVPDF